MLNKLPPELIAALLRQLADDDLKATMHVNKKIGYLSTYELILRSKNIPESRLENYIIYLLENMKNSTDICKIKYENISQKILLSIIKYKLKFQHGITDTEYKYLQVISTSYYGQAKLFAMIYSLNLYRNNMKSVQDLFSQLVNKFSETKEIDKFMYLLTFKEAFALFTVEQKTLLVLKIISLLPNRVHAENFIIFNQLLVENYDSLSTECRNKAISYLISNVKDDYWRVVAERSAEALNKIMHNLTPEQRNDLGVFFTNKNFINYERNSYTCSRYLYCAIQLFGILTENQQIYIVFTILDKLNYGVYRHLDFIAKSIGTIFPFLSLRLRDNIFQKLLNSMYSQSYLRDLVKHVSVDTVKLLSDNIQLDFLDKTLDVIRRYLEIDLDFTILFKDLSFDEKLSLSLDMCRKKDLSTLMRYTTPVCVENHIKNFLKARIESENIRLNDLFYSYNYAEDEDKEKLIRILARCKFELVSYRYKNEVANNLHRIVSFKSEANKLMDEILQDDTHQPLMQFSDSDIFGNDAPAAAAKIKH